MRNRSLVGDLIEDHFKGITPKYSVSSNTIVLNQKCIRNNTIYWDLARFVDDNQQFSDKKYLKEGDILINSTGVGTAGRCTFLNMIPEGFKVVTDSHILVLRCKEKTLSKLLAYYLFSIEGILMSSMTGSSGQGELDKLVLFQIETLFPQNKNEQTQIAKVLSDLDAKIELNNKINAELEAMAKLIYDYWFVQFDFPYDFKQGKVADDSSNPKDVVPYKSSGGKMVYNEELKRAIPEDWEAGTLDNIANLVRGVSYSKTDVKSKEFDGVTPILRATNISGNVIDLNNMVYVPDEFVNKKQLLNKFDILITMSSGSKNHIGKNGLYYFNEKVAFGAFCAKLVAKNSFTFYLSSFMQSEFVSETIQKECLGTNINNLNGTLVKGFKVVIPPKSIIENFNKKVAPIYSKLANNLKQNQELASLRDWLLPMLMNGQISTSLNLTKSASRLTDGQALDLTKKSKGQEVYANEFEVGVAAEGEGEYVKKPQKKSAIPPRNYLTLIKSNFSDFENQATLGEGIYTIPDLANILKQPIDKVRRWINTFFDDKFANEFKANYSWKVDKSKAVNFYTMIELVTMFNLSKQGLSTREIVKSHNSLVKMYHTPHPYADKKVMEDLKINGKKLIAKLNGIYVNTDGSNQLNFNFISQLLENIDFDDNLAIRYYPMGKKNSIVIDPKRKFGSAVVGGTNIYPETLYSYYKGGENIKYIAALFEIDEQMVKDAISFCKSAA